MSLITRCSACGTMFKVVADQLKISQGWVRCGHCAEVFDAAANLQPYVPQSAAGASLSPAPAQQDPDEKAGAASVAPMLVAPSADAETVESGEVPADEAASVAASASLPEVQVSPSPDLAADVFAFSESPEPSGYSVEVSAADPTLYTDSDEFGTPAHEEVHDVSFVREARRDAFWRRPGMRWALAVGAFFLLGLLLLQVAVFQRNTLAAWQPQLGPGLQAMCERLGCVIKAPQQIESVVIDSSSFNKLAADAYRLRMVIKNTGTIPLAMPSLELTLTDTQDQAVLRRVLAPADLGSSSNTLAPGAEFSGAVTIKISSSAASPAAAASGASELRPLAPFRIAGYRILAFYP